MNRETEFRGKRVDNSEWIYGSLFHDIIRNEFFISDGTHPWDEVIPSTVSQYTGLKDKNGVKIFEGDILGFELEGETHCTCPVSWVEEGCGWGLNLLFEQIIPEDLPLQYYPKTKDIYEVIGTIHDTEEPAK